MAKKGERPSVSSSTARWRPGASRRSAVAEQPSIRTAPTPPSATRRAAARSRSYPSRDRTCRASAGFVAEEPCHPRRRDGLGRVEAVGVPAQGLQPREHRGARPASTKVSQWVWISSAASSAETGRAQVRDRLVDVAVVPEPLRGAPCSCGSRSACRARARSAPRRRTGGGTGTSALHRRAGPGTGCCARGRRAAPPSRSFATASHSGAQNRSRIDIVMMKSRTRSVLAQHLLSEVAGDEPVVRRCEFADELVGVRPAGQATGWRGRRRPASPRSGPRAARAPRRTAGPAPCSSAAASSVVKLSCSARISAEHPRGAQPAQPKAGVGAGDDDQMGLLGEVLDQELDLLATGG